MKAGPRTCWAAVLFQSSDYFLFGEGVSLKLLRLMLNSLYIPSLTLKLCSFCLVLLGTGIMGCTTRPNSRSRCLVFFTVLSYLYQTIHKLINLI